MVALDTPLNNRQLEVLRWVGEQCPPREWPDSTYKTVAAALQNRRLITVSKKGGRWTATLLDAGRYYLDHGTYPDGHLKPKKRITDHSPVRTVVRNVPRALSDGADASAEKPEPKTPTLTPSRQLLHDVSEAGGTLTRNTTDDRTNYTGLVSAINRHAMAPEGQRLVMESGSTYYEKIFRFEDLPTWKTTPPRDVVDAPRIGRWHPAAAQIRDDNGSRFSSEVRTRALRILHALATEAETRGHSVSMLPKNNPRGDGRYAHKETGQLIISIRGHHFYVDLQQLDDYTPHTPTPQELEKQRKWEWSKPPRWDTAPGRRLRLRVYGDIFRGWDEKWADSKSLKIRVEDHLADAMAIIEASVDREESCRAAELRAIEEQARRREAAEQLVAGRHAENVRAEVLDRQFADWQHTGALRQYLEAMAAGIDTITDTEARTSATEWLRWCERHVDSLDPLRRPLTMPAIRPPTWEENSALTREIMEDLAAQSKPWGEV
ncbi:hypothetical protein B2J88_50515 [Rhodococcus sp. SRB_17]|nr:hypothetical protein [Rhodococcus sp. SRB_17]